MWKNFFVKHIRTKSLAKQGILNDRRNKINDRVLKNNDFGKFGAFVQ